MDFSVFPDVVGSNVDDSRCESDHVPTRIGIHCQPSIQAASASRADGGQPWPKQSWGFSFREEYMQRLDTDSLQLEDGVQLARNGAIAESCQPLSSIVAQAAASAGCCRRAATATRRSWQPKRDHRPFFDWECKDLKWLYQCTRSH
ncbi:hypothetical protein WJX74_007863 [Apatococcus lobatus]|uniref:Uncharacterized protein n=1 Tax=Apatococcus lobatus TaxID=904363 RepID=A0AAW1RSU6_9CHLO